MSDLDEFTDFEDEKKSKNSIPQITRGGIVPHSEAEEGEEGVGDAEEDVEDEAESKKDEEEGRADELEEEGEIEGDEVENEEYQEDDEEDEAEDKCEEEINNISSGSGDYPKEKVHGYETWIKVNCTALSDSWDRCFV